MTLKSKEHQEIMAAFENVFKHYRLDREPKDVWQQGNVYQDGHVNQLFLAFRHGVAYGKAVYES